ncbi:MAG TPA: tyrosine-protein phosphatase [Armatimonadota bacterium]|jgi:protein tyrosine/serine phosphatase
MTLFPARPRPLAICLAVAALAPCAFAKVPAGLPNFQTVAPGIYRGAAPTRQGLAALKAMGVHTVIDLRIAPKTVRAEKAAAERLGLAWMNIPMGKEAPTRKQVDRLLAALAKAPREPVFVHCQHGADRTGAMIGIYRVQVQKWPFDRAYAEMRRYGFKPYLTELKNAVRSRATR